MANAQVEKLKALGLRHGEKAVVGLSAALCLLFLVFAVTKETIPLTPDQVAASAKAAETNLQRRQEPDDILKRLEDEGIKNPGFEKLVDAQAKEEKSPLAYKVARPWVTLEPGAGLIRDQPELIAPTELLAYAGRGGTALWALDDSGKRILEDPDKKVEPAVKARRKKKRRRAGGMGGMAGMMGGRSGGMGMRGMMGASKKKSSIEEEKREAARKEKQLKGLLAGKEGDEPAKGKDETEKSEEGGPWKEVTKGLRWVAITGVLDHKKMRDNFALALKDSAANPNYKQLDLERQVRDSDGEWSDWEAVDWDKNHKEILFQLPEEEEELTPDTVRIDSLVDPLPFLKAGYWEKVHVVSLVPKEKREIPKPPAGGNMMSGMSMPGGMSMAGGGMSMPGGMSMSGSGGMSMPGGMSMSGMSMPGGMSMTSEGMAGGGQGGVENTEFQKSEADTLMVRALDFTVEPDATYRFRVRVVVYNPNYKHENVTPGVNTEDLELEGPWSEPTGEVTMPADTAAYALRKTPTAAGSKRKDLVSFQLVKWNPDDGVTVVRNSDYAPGQIVGETFSTPIPSSDGSKVKNKPIDYNSRHILLDETGGLQPIAQVGASGAPLEVPAVSVMMRYDGALVLRDEANDLVDPVRKDTDENYKRELKESGKERQNSQGSMYGSMMGSMGGMSGMGR